MKLTYQCTNGEHCNKDNREQCVHLKIESVMDENNIAVMFCLKCGSQLKRVE